ncbi:hypothetical protein ABS71_13190 [bacterium SCN 62-11]|nr:MAG: hypothetical protein ABS71_13190 [bacterium SCN 62-11]
MLKGSSGSSLTYDLFYYAADLRLGPPWCFEVVSWTHQSFLFYTFGYLAYFLLSHTMSLIAAWWVLSPRGPNPILYFMACAMISGGLGYWICPGVGPEIVFGKSFPFDPPRVDAPMMLEVPGGPPRNTMPSLHLLWAYSIWVSVEGRHRLLRLAGLAYLTFMPLVAFLGRHYLVDYVVALSLATAVHVLVLKLSLPGNTDNKLLAWAAASFCCAPAYLFLLLSGSSVWLVWPWLLQGFTAISVGLAIVSSLYLSRQLQ